MSNSDHQSKSEQNRLDMLEQRIQALETQYSGHNQQTSGQSGVTRRQTIAGLLGWSALLGASGTVGAQSGNNDTTPPFADEDHDHSGDFLGETAPVDHTDVNRLDIGEIYNKGGTDTAILSAWDGLVVPIAPGLGANTAIDPNGTDTPVQDAIDLLPKKSEVKENTPVGGHVIIPPEGVTNNGGITIHEGVKVRGFGPGTKPDNLVSEIHIAAEGVDLVTFAGSGNNNPVMAGLDGVALTGPGWDAKTGVAIHIPDQFGRCRIGRVYCRAFANALLKTAGGANEAYIGQLIAEGFDPRAGGTDTAVDLTDSLLHSTVIDVLGLYPIDWQSNKPIETAMKLDRGMHMLVNFLNVGGATRRAVVKTSHGGSVSFRHVHLEPHLLGENYNEDVESIVEGHDAGMIHVGKSSFHSDFGGLKYAYRMRGRVNHNNFFGPFDGTRAPTENVVSIDSNTTGKNIVWASSSEVDNNSGGALLHPVACLGDLTTVGGEGEPDVVSIPKQSLAIDGDVSDLSTDHGLSLTDDFGAFSGTYTNSGTVWLTWDADNLYLAASLQDDEHVQTYSEGQTWREDCIQFGVASGAPGKAEKWDQMDIALVQNGPEVYRRVLPEMAVEGVMDSASSAIVRTNQRTIYEVAHPWSDLTASPDDEYVSLSIAIHDVDDSGETNTGWLEWGSGILGGKNHGLYKAADLVE